MLVSLHFGGTVVLAADTRVMDIIDGQLSFGHDADTKIQPTGIGFVAGMGLVELLDDVKRRLLHAEITHTDQVWRIIRDARSRYRAGTLMPDPDSWVRQTGWFVSYRTVVDGQLRMRVGIFHQSLEEEDPSGLRLQEECSAYLGARDDRIEEPVAAVRARLVAAVRSYVGSSDPLALAEFSRPLLQEAFAQVSSVQPSVAPTFHLVFQTTADARGFSEMLSPADQGVRWRALM